MTYCNASLCNTNGATQIEPTQNSKCKQEKHEGVYNIVPSGLIILSGPLEIPLEKWGV